MHSEKCDMHIFLSFFFIFHLFCDWHLCSATLSQNFAELPFTAVICGTPIPASASQRLTLLPIILWKIAQAPISY